MSETEPVLKLTVSQFNAITEERLPFARLMGLELTALNTTGAEMRAKYSDEFLRPGGTIAGPVMMGLADAAAYAAILSRIGPVELAVTTNLTINFLRKPSPGDVVAHARLLKLGKRLAVVEVHLYFEDQNYPVAHATTTYSIPPPDSAQVNT